MRAAPRTTLAVLFATLAPDVCGAAEIRYGRDVRPLLSDRCFRCHGPDEAAREADLRLDVFEAATADRGGYSAIVPGNAERSELWSRITDPDPELGMPPSKSHKPRLSDAELDVVRRWIESGARYEPHWSFVAPVRPALPAVRDSSWCENEIDRFVLATLEREGVTPSPTAPAAVLLRRVFLDLTGLPPTLGELDAYLGDRESDAYERVVDRLLTEEPYVSRGAEHRAVPWLDAARYADTCGIHTDAGRSIWPWRDWVLRALRDHMPFDRFLTEQLAGDLLPDATLDQKVASGFNRNHVTTDEGGAIAEEALVEYAVDRTSTTASVFLGLTMGCARCHDHKFDPITQQEFYELYAYFSSIEEPGLYSQLPDAQRAFEPAMEVPTAAQEGERARLTREVEAERARLDETLPEESQARDAYFAALVRESALDWESGTVLTAQSTGGATLAVQSDGSVLASGANPDRDEHAITVRLDGTHRRLLALEALPDASFFDGRVGRAGNGNAVLTGIEARAHSVRDPSLTQLVRFVWAWADREQPDGDYAVTQALDVDDELGWAADAHRHPGGRVALFLADASFGFEGGTELVVRLQYDSVYAQHVFGRVRLSTGSLSDTTLASLPAAFGRWNLVGPFPADSGASAFGTAFGPESERTLDRAKNFGSGNQFWRHDPALVDGRLNGGLPQGTNVTYVAREVFAPSPQSFDVSIGSDDGFRLFADGVEVASREIDRSLAADQDEASLALGAGRHVIVFKIVNTGGEAGFYWRAQDTSDHVSGDVVAALLPERALSAELRVRMQRAWQVAFSPGYRARVEKLAKLEKELADVQSSIARTMVMQELATPRETFVLTRGQYDHPDTQRKVSRGVPKALGALPADAPADRRGLAQWMTSAENPLVARVAVNRMWEQIFGAGLVRTSEDFGLQGEWPSHPELLDWLAVELRESGWDTRAMLRRIVTSRTYRQDARVRPDVVDRDPDNRWLAYMPRRRLSAEAIRDGALYVSGLLSERLGGPSVKPYQPDGLWEEVAMPASNTRVYARGGPDELWRRSVYTYWKRAAPPPSMLALDAPTRESCTVRRPVTNTPLQALVLWNDVQFVEAARAFAARTLAESGDDRVRLASMFRRATGRSPDAPELDDLAQALADFRVRYRAAPDDAAKLVAVGASEPPSGLDDAELAAWTMIGSALFSLDGSLCRG